MARPRKNSSQTPSKSELVEGEGVDALSEILLNIAQLKEITEPDKALAKVIDGRLRLMLEHETVKAITDRLHTVEELQELEVKSPDETMKARIRFIIELHSAPTLEFARMSHNDKEALRGKAGHHRYEFSDDQAVLLKRAYLRAGLAGLEKYAEAARATVPLPFDNFSYQMVRAVNAKIDASLATLRDAAEQGPVSPDLARKIADDIKSHCVTTVISIDAEYPWR